MQIKDYVISSPKYDTYVKVFGELEGKTPLIILHGGPGGFMDSYDNLCLLSYFDVPVILYNQHGSFKSPVKTNKFDEIYTLESFSEELETVINYFKLDSYYLLGHSYGVMLALYFVIHKNPANLKKLVLFSGLHNSKMWNEECLKMCKKDLSKDLYEAVLNNYNHLDYDKDKFDEAIKIFLAKHNKPKNKPVKYFFLGEKPPLNLDAYNYMWGPSEIFATGTLLDFDVTNELNKITVPTLILSGLRDESSNKINHTMYRKIKTSSRITLLKSAHSAYQEEPIKTLKILTKFLSKKKFSLKYLRTAGFFTKTK